jgi:hypothetical protein
MMSMRIIWAKCRDKRSAQNTVASSVPTDSQHQDTGRRLLIYTSMAAITKKNPRLLGDHMPHSQVSRPTMSGDDTPRPPSKGRCQWEPSSVTMEGEAGGPYPVRETRLATTMDKTCDSRTVGWVRGPGGS